MIGGTSSDYWKLDCMARTLVILAAVLLGAGTWVALIYLFRYSGIALLESATFWISPIAVTGWLLCLVLIAIYYWLFSSVWLTGGGTGI
jgi:hypothetical protein